MTVQNALQSLHRRLSIAGYLLVSCLTLAPLSQTGDAAPEPPAEWTHTDDTVFLIVPSADTSDPDIVQNLSPGTVPRVKGSITSVPDAELGRAFAFGESDSAAVNEITFGVTAPVEALRGKGFTFECWVQRSAESGRLIGGKYQNTIMLNVQGMGLLRLRDGKFSAPYLTLPSDRVVSSGAPNFVRSFPSSYVTNGRITVEESAWTHLAMTYDERSQMFRTYVNGVLDREGDIFRKGEQWIKIKPSDFRLFTHFSEGRVGGVRLRSGVHSPGPVPLCNAHVNTVPWATPPYLLVSCTNLDQDQELPFQISVDLPDFPELSTSQTISSHSDAFFRIPLPEGTVGTYDIRITAEKDAQNIFQDDFTFTNRRPDPTMANGVSINSDLSLQKKGQKEFPLFIYEAFNNQLGTVRDLGFDIALPRGQNLSLPAWLTSRYQLYLDASRETGMNALLTHGRTATGNYAHWGTLGNDPANDHIIFMYGRDEPFSHWDSFYRDYQDMRFHQPNYPVFSLVNFIQHAKNTGPTCDILGTDPYPVPLVSLRSVFWHTERAQAASFFTKPTFTVLGAYRGKLPNLSQLRCMAYLAICAGTHGIGLYDYDARQANADNEIIGPGFSYLPNYPDALAAVDQTFNELKQLKPILAEPVYPGLITVPEDELAIHPAIKVYQGKRYLFLANDSYGPESSILTLASGQTLTATPLPQSDYTADLVFENGQCSVTLPPLQTGVFLLPDPPAGIDAEARGFALWAGLSGIDNIPGGDADADGYTNFSEYVFSTDPLAPDRPDTTTTSGDGGSTHIRFRILSQAQNLTAMLQTSSTLRPDLWSDMPGATLILEKKEPSIDHMRFEVPVSGPTAFYRLRIVEAP